MVPKELIPHAAILKVLARSKPKILARQIKLLSPQVIRAIKDISKNVIKGSVRLSKSTETKTYVHIKSCFQS